MNAAEMREMKSEELHVELEQLRRHAFDLRSQAVTEKLENPFQLTMARRSIARLLTILRERGEKDIEQRQRHLEAEAARRKRE